MKNYLKLTSLLCLFGILSFGHLFGQERKWQKQMQPQSVSDATLMENSMHSHQWPTSDMQILKMREDFKSQQNSNRNHGERHFMEGPVCELMAHEVNDPRRVAPPEAFLRAQQSGSRDDCANIMVTYNGFTPEAQAAFQHAVDIWESLITSPVTIRVNANYVPLGPGVLGSAGPVFIWRDFPGAVPGTWYGEALADKINGGDLSGPGTPDIVANFSSTFAWYFGRDGQAPPGTFDFVTVVLHELGHGLGFFGSANAIPSPVLGIYGFSSPAFPTIYDRFTEDGGGTTTTSIAPPGVVSPALGAHFQSDNLFVDGPNANAGNGGSRPKIYAPFPFRGGSSYSHWDEATFPPGNPQSLMTPFLSFQEANHNPGPATLGMFEDHGWMRTRDCPEVRPIDDRERCDITGIQFDPNFPAPGVCHEQFVDPTVTSPGTFVACFRLDGVNPYNQPVDASGYRVVINGQEKPILALGYDIDGGGNQYFFICVGEISVMDNQTVFVELERGCTYTRRDWLDAPPCDVPAGTNCDITGVREVELTCFDEQQQAVYGENTYGVCVTFDAVDFIPEIFTYFQAVVNNREIDIVSGQIIPGGFRICFVMEKEGKRGNDLFVRVDMDRGCTFTARDLWDDLPRDCRPTGDDDDDDDDDCRLDVVSFTLINADTDMPVAGYDPIPEGARIDLCGLGRINIRANVCDERTRSVRMRLSGRESHNQTESVAPYALFGDNGGDYHGRNLSAGNYTLEGTAYDGGGGSGNSGATKTLNFTLEDCRRSASAASLNGLNIFPNPTNGQLNIESNFDYNTNLLILNSIGQTVYRGTLQAFERKQIEMSQFDDGLYIVRIEGEDAILTKRIILTK